MAVCSTTAAATIWKVRSGVMPGSSCRAEAGRRASRGIHEPSAVRGSSIRSLPDHPAAGYPAAGWSGSERMLLPRTALGSWIPRLARLPASARQELPGITPDRTFQIVAAAVVLHTAMTALGVEELEVSPWALREGVLLRYIESLSWSEPAG